MTWRDGGGSTTVSRCHLTLQGQVVLASAVVLTVSGYLLGLGELYSLAAAVAALVVVAWLWVCSRRWSLEVHRHVHPSRVAAGGEARIELTVRNRGDRSTPPVDARDPFDGGRRWARFSIAPLAPGESRRSSYRLPSNRRGVYHLGPLELRVGDPFGLAVRVATTAPDTSLTVHPRYDLLPVVGVSSHQEDGRRIHHSVIGRGGTEFHMLREYVPGDDLRHVHWPSTARLDDLVIRQPENLRRGRVTVVADLRAEVHDEHSIEAVLSAAASVAMSSLRAGLHVRVVTTAGFDSGHGARAQGPALLDGLAAASAHSSRSGGAPFRVAATNDPVVLITTDRSADSDVESAFGMGGPAGTTVVVFATTRGGDGNLLAGTGRADARGGGHLVHVRPGESFAATWRAAAAAQC